MSTIVFDNHRTSPKNNHTPSPKTTLRGTVWGGGAKANDETFDQTRPNSTPGDQKTRYAGTILEHPLVRHRHPSLLAPRFFSLSLRSSPSRRCLAATGREEDSERQRQRQRQRNGARASASELARERESKPHTHTTSSCAQLPRHAVACVHFRSARERYKSKRAPSRPPSALSLSLSLLSLL
eukprot:753032-Rhodomonas_salina.2